MHYIPEIKGIPVFIYIYFLNLFFRDQMKEKISEIINNIKGIFRIRLYIPGVIYNIYLD